MSGEKPKLHLLVKSAGVEKTYTYAAHEFVIGRSAEHADLALEVSALSRKHLRLRIEGTAVSVADLGSKNGTSLGGIELQPNQFMPLPVGTVLKLGKENDFLVVTQIESSESVSAIEVESELIAFPIATDESTAIPRPLFSKKGRSRTKSSEPTLFQIDDSPKATESPAPELIRADVQAKEIVQQAETISQELLLKSELTLRDAEAFSARVAAEARELQTRSEQLATQIPEQEAVLNSHLQNISKLNQELSTLSEKTDQLETSRIELETKFDEQNLIVESKEADIARFEERLRAKQALVNTLDKKSNELELKLIDGKREHEELITKTSELTEQKHKLDRFLVETTDHLDAAKTKLAETLESQRREEEAYSLSSRKVRAEFEAAKAEAELRKARLEVEIEEANGRRLVEQRTSGLARIERQEVEKRTAAGRDQEVRLRAELVALEQHMTNGKLSLKNSEALTLAAQTRLNELHLERQALDRQMRDDELHRSALLAKAEKTAEATVRDARVKADRLAAERRDEEDHKHTDYIADLESQRLQKAQAIETEMATLRLKTSEGIGRMRTDFYKNRDRKKKLEISEIARAVSQIVEIRTGAQIEDDISEVVKSVIESVWNLNSKSLGPELNDLATVNPNASAQGRRFWLSLFLKGLFGLSLIGVAAAIPAVISLIRENFHAEKARGEAASMAQAERAQHNRDSRLFRPDRNLEYRPTYWENLIYADHYLELKNDPDLQKKWVLALNKYLIKNFDSNDRLIVDFISQEKALIVQLMPMAAVLSVDALEAGLVHMKQTEFDAQPGFLKVFKSQDNYKKFRDFEKEFYLEHGPEAKKLTEKLR